MRSNTLGYKTLSKFQHIFLALLSWRQRLLLIITALIGLQVVALLILEGVHFGQAIKDIVSPGYSYDALLGRELDVELLRQSQAFLPPDARILNLVESNAPYRYHFYPTYSVHLRQKWRTDEALLDDILEHQITHIIVWEADAYSHSSLLQNERCFRLHDFGANHLIVEVVDFSQLQGATPCSQ